MVSIIPDEFAQIARGQDDPNQIDVLPAEEGRARVEELRPCTPRTPIIEVTGLNRLISVWSDLLFSDKSVSAVTTLHLYGYLMSILMSLAGWSHFASFGHTSTVVTKIMIQLIGLIISSLGIHACYKRQPKKLSLFFVYQLTHTILVLSGLFYLLRTSRRELYEDFVMEPYYNMKLVDYPFGAEKNVVDMSAEPAFEISMLYFRAVFMLIVTNLFNIYTLYAVGRKLLNQNKQEDPVVPNDGEQLGLRRIDEQNDDPGNVDAIERARNNPINERLMSFAGKVGLLFGL